MRQVGVAHGEAHGLGDARAACRAGNGRRGHRRRHPGGRPQEPCYFHGMTSPDDAKAIRFGTSGWRAVLAEEFTFGNARRVIAAIARVLAADGRAGGLVLVGYDTRFLADRFAAEAAAIFVRHGFPAQVSVRPVPTPVLAFEIRRTGAVGAVNFTASHNPPQY